VLAKQVEDVVIVEFLPGLPGDLIRAAYAAAPGSEIASGKFHSPESSAALVANTFGLFLDRPADMPALCQGQNWGWPPRSVQLEAIVRFPWSGGRHPCLDVLVEVTNAMIGVESKRFEPFRAKPVAVLSDAYWRPVWGERMGRYAAVRDAMADGTSGFRRLDAAQLIKHAFGLRTAARRRLPRLVRPVLLYLHAEPDQWPDGRAVPLAAIETHRQEVAIFANLVAGDEVEFRATSYRDILGSWSASPLTAVRDHVDAVRGSYRF
jgi:hypothetical protein